MIPPFIESLLVKDQGLVVYDPASGQLIGRVPIVSLAEANEAIIAADEARRDWAQHTAKERALVLRAWFDLILTHKAELAALCTAECGKPLAEAAGEVVYAASFVEWFAEEGKRAYGETIPTFARGKRVLTLKQPVGTCAAITPWNFPLAMITRKVGPALAAGCSILVKPAEATPLSALALVALATKAGLPKNLFQVLTTDDPVAMGKLFCEHPLIRKLSFTGSTAVGKRLIAQAASTVKRVSMELGGNAPFIVFSDADLDAAADGFMQSKYRNSGQTCVCANRLLVEDSIHDAFVEKVRSRVAALKVGPGAEAGVQIGPLIDDRAMAKVTSMVGQALTAGATLVIGGQAHPAGKNFFAPTILTNVNPGMDIAASEIFGPVTSIIRFKDESEAIQIANDTPFGLAAYFYARDIGKVWRVTEALEYGMVAVNEGMLSSEVAPFGGIKESGLGREGSSHGLDEYLELKYALMGGLGG